MRRYIAINTCSITSFRKECFPVPKLDHAYEVVMFIGMRILITKFYLYLKFLSPFNCVRTENMGHMSIEIIAFYLFIFLFYLCCFKYPWHSNYFQLINKFLILNNS